MGVELTSRSGSRVACRQHTSSVALWALLRAAAQDIDEGATSAAFAAKAEWTPRLWVETTRAWRPCSGRGVLILLLPKGTLEPLIQGVLPPVIRPEEDPLHCLLFDGTLTVQVGL